MGWQNAFCYTLCSTYCTFIHVYQSMLMSVRCPCQLPITPITCTTNYRHNHSMSHYCVPHPWLLFYQVILNDLHGHEKIGCMRRTFFHTEHSFFKPLCENWYEKYKLFQFSLFTLLSSSACVSFINFSFLLLFSLTLLVCNCAVVIYVIFSL